eukprot:TRINITY_DN764_c0_g1_i11.p1 TRINITY_DN764_c0_g1~~TRINITY_DN764_c0_g1_i11.p1  ORF type:complete len:503 (-),score=92.71 TRINITY_DN764_c0_g1_i11:67-1575(-)
MYPKKAPSQTSQQNSKGPKLTEERKQRLLAIQQRESLKGMIVNKFLEKYGGKKNQQLINDEVSKFIRNQKVTEENLKALEAKIKAETGNQQQQSQQGSKPVSKAPSKASEKPSMRDVRELSEHHGPLPGQQQYQYSQQGGSEAQSITSSKAPRSVYQLPDEDDEWAAILRFDQELYKKEKELEQQREYEQKRKIKNELDKQLHEKHQIKQMDNEEQDEYNKMQEKMLEIYDQREREKEQERQRKIMHEKQSRDRQLQDEIRRKKDERKREKEIDDLLVQRIKEELTMEQELIRERKKEEREHLQKVLKESEENKFRQEEENKQERLADIRAQNEYIRLVEEQEREREQELKKREEKAKAFMAMMSDTVIKDQKAQIAEEESKILRHYKDKELREKEEDRQKRLKEKQQKEEMRQFLNKQVQEKEQRKKMEDELNSKQAQFWKKDTDEFFDNEKRKNDYIKQVNLKHADILQQQMSDKHSKNCLLYTSPSPRDRQKSRMPSSA